MTTLKKVITEESNYNPKLSVIVPVYKVEKYLVRCIDSILAQTFVDFELLLIDDGSPDKSGDICDEYACKDTRIRVFHKENGGVSSARNLGLENVRGNILTFIDADDWIDVDCFENGVCIMDRDDLDILQYSYKMIREQDGCVISVRNYECVPLGWREFVRTDHYIVCVGGNFIRSSIVKTYRLRFDEALHLAEDQLFIMRVMSLSTRIAQTKEIYDFLTNSVMMPIAAIATCLLVSRVIGVDKIEQEVELDGRPFRRKRIFRFMIRWLCPVFAAVILASSVANAFGIIKM